MTSPQSQIKSRARVQDLGEVYTPANIVQDMLDLLPDSMWAVNPSPTFLEPTCGNGNFLEAILDRKLAEVHKLHERGELPFGSSSTALSFHSLEAVSSVYGVDISPENVKESITRLRRLYIRKRQEFNGNFLRPRVQEHRLMTAFLRRNIVEGDTLNDKIRVFSYVWDGKKRTVTSHSSFIGVKKASLIGTKSFQELSTLFR